MFIHLLAHSLDALREQIVPSGASDIIVAILDTGAQLDYEDLVDNLWANPGEFPGNDVDDDANGKVDHIHGWRFYHAWNGEDFVLGEDNQVADDHGHGTHVAGVVGALEFSRSQVPAGETALRL